jgi:hypothetical protein
VTVYTLINCFFYSQEDEVKRANFRRCPVSGLRVRHERLLQAYKSVWRLPRSDDA